MIGLNVGEMIVEVVIVMEFCVFVEDIVMMCYVYLMLIEVVC